MKAMGWHSVYVLVKQSLLASLHLPFHLSSAGVYLYDSVNPIFTFWKGGLFPKTNTFLQQQYLTYK